MHTVALVLLLVCQPAWAVDYIRLASWNIENLGNRTPRQRELLSLEHSQVSGDLP